MTTKFLTQLKPKNVSNHATLDVETLNFEGKHYVSCITFLVNGNVFMVNLSEYLEGLEVDQVNSELLLAANKDMWVKALTMIKPHVKAKTSIFAHNLGKFDGYLMLPGLLEFFKTKPQLVRPVIDANKSFVFVTILPSELFPAVVFKDSLRIFPDSLSGLAKKLGLGGKLTEYKLDKWHNLSFFINVDKDSAEWKEFIIYAEYDVVLLSCILLESSFIYAKDYGVDLFSTVSTSNLAVKVFRTKFLEPITEKAGNKGIPVLNKSTDNYIRQAYFGGSTQCLIKGGSNLYHYDVNSLYPAAMIRPMPCMLLGVHWGVTDLSTYFGFAEVTVSYTGDDVPLLPYRSHSGSVSYPKGTWSGIYFIPELLEAANHGYTYTVTGPVWEFTKFYPFTSYVNHFYKLKQTTTGYTKMLNKLMLNTLYGFFARKLDLDLTYIVDSPTLDKLLCLDNNVVSSYYDLNDNLYLVSIILSKIKDKDGLQEILQEKAKPPIVLSNIAVGGAITSYARIIMMPFKRIPGNDLYYTDTDSLIYSKPLDSKFVSDTELGLLKDELGGGTIIEGVFLGPKMYGYKYTTPEGKLLTKTVFAGVPRNQLTFEQLDLLSQGQTVTLPVSERILPTLENLFVATVKPNDKNLSNLTWLHPDSVTGKYPTPVVNDIRTIYGKPLELPEFTDYDSVDIDW